MNSSVAILTGDLVGSTSLQPAVQEQAFAAIGEAAAKIAAWPAVTHPTNFTRQRGDGWQLVVVPPKFALRAALVVRASLRSQGDRLGTRISIAVGPERLPDSGNLNLASGPVFVASGRGLDGLKGAAQMCHAAGGPIQAATRLADHISQGWTPAQAQVISHLLHLPGRTQAQIAKRLGKTQQAVQQAAAGAGARALLDALAAIENGP